MDTAAEAEKILGIRLGFAKCLLLTPTGKAPIEVIDALVARGWQKVEVAQYTKYWGVKVGFRIPEEELFKTPWIRFWPRRGEIQELGMSMKQKMRVWQSHIDTLFGYNEGYRPMPRKEAAKLKHSLHEVTGMSSAEFHVFAA